MKQKQIPYWSLLIMGGLTLFLGGCSLIPNQVEQHNDTSGNTTQDQNQPKDVYITSFDDCVQAGYPVQESYPRRCAIQDADGMGGEVFFEEVGNGEQKKDLIQLASPLPQQIISSPLTITGEAKGNWYFEATFPIVLTDWDGKIIAEGYATAQGDWMTTAFVPFTATLEFETPSYGVRGSLILQKSNASGLPEHDDALEIPVRFANQ